MGSGTEGRSYGHPNSYSLPTSRHHYGEQNGHRSIDDIPGPPVPSSQNGAHIDRCHNAPGHGGHGIYHRHHNYHSSVRRCSGDCCHWT